MAAHAGLQGKGGQLALTGEPIHCQGDDNLEPKGGAERAEEDQHGFARTDFFDGPEHEVILPDDESLAGFLPGAEGRRGACRV